MLSKVKFVFQELFQSLYLYCISVYCFPFVFNLFSRAFVFVSMCFCICFPVFLHCFPVLCICFPVLLYLFLCFVSVFSYFCICFPVLLSFSPWDFVSLGFCIVFVLSKIVSQPPDIPCSANRWSVNNVFSKCSSHCQKNHQEEP